jgi:hypothetical protein
MQGVAGTEEPEEEEEETYCDQQGCSRKFPHKHISAEGSGLGGHAPSSTSSSLLVNEAAAGSGMEALDGSYFNSL